MHEQEIEVEENGLSYILAKKELSDMRKGEYLAESTMYSAKAQYERVMADRAAKKIQWVEYWMIYSIMLISLFIIGFYVIAHALAVQ